MNVILNLSLSFTLSLSLTLAPSFTHISGGSVPVKYDRQTDEASYFECVNSDNTHGNSHSERTWLKNGKDNCRHESDIVVVAVVVAKRMCIVVGIARTFVT
jgi:hypothetical protein